ncbi:hypothetical protein LTR85_010773 [Meristemomyces frigidus]|nr:hypothetical protein LTR85_010773 [Meristemomyces frigidus]
MPGFLKVFGYADPSSPLGYGIDTTVQQLITSLLTLGSFVSSFAAGPFSSVLGRKPALWTACALNAVACAIMLATTDTGVLYFGRLLMGFANGFLVTFSAVYNSEVAPAQLRGVMVALFAYWVNIGSIIGAVVDNYTSTVLDKRAYQIPIACLYIIPVFLSVALLFIPESPRWLLHQGADSKARAALERLRPSSVPAEYLELEWAEMLRGVEEEKSHAKSVGVLDMFRGVIGIKQTFRYSIMNACFGFIGVNVGMVLIRKVLGRRSILMLGATICGLCQLIPAIAWSAKPASKTSATELVSSRLRAWTAGTGTSLGYVFAWLCGFCSPYFINPTDLNWGAQYGYIWAASNFLCVCFFYLCMPEMKGRSLEELDEIFLARVAAKKFKGYQCHITEDAVQDVKGQGVDLKEAVDRASKML